MRPTGSNKLFTSGRIQLNQPLKGESEDLGE